MKFGKQLKVNLYQPWSAYYVPYARLKRMIARIEHARKPRRSGYNSVNPSRDNSFNSLNAFSPPTSESLPLKHVPGVMPPKVKHENKYHPF